MPTNLTDAVMAYDSEDGYVVLFGGCPGFGEFGSCGSQAVNATWSYSNGTWKNLSTLTAPPARAAAVMADDPSADGVILFGGAGLSGSLNDTWEFRAGQWTELQPSRSPPPLQLASMAYDAADQELVLFGGEMPGTLNASGQTWVFKEGNWSNETPLLRVSPPGWISSVLAPDPAGGVLAEGGISALFFPSYYQETWRFVHGVWTNITGASGSPMPDSSAFGFGVYDPVVNRTIVFGGGTATSMPDDVWSYGPGTGWSELSPANTPAGTAFYATEACWDGADGYVLAFSLDKVGSFYGIPMIESVANQTWALLSPLATAIAGNATYAIGANASLRAIVAGGAPPYRYRWDLGDGTISTAENVTHPYPRAGSYNVVLTVTDRAGDSSTAGLTVTVENSSSPSAATSSSPTLTLENWEVACLCGGSVVALGALVTLLPKRK